MTKAPFWTSKRVLELEESQTLAMAARSRALAEQGIEIINLSLGEPDFDTPDHIKAAACRAVEDNYSHYTPVAGYADLRQAVCHKMSHELGWNVGPGQVVFSTGAKQSLINVLLSVLNPGDEVLLPAPYWVSYAGMIQMAEAKAVVVVGSPANGYKVLPEQLEAAITSKTRLLLYSSPCNPSGAAYHADELAAWAEVLRRHPGILVVSDEIYEHIRFEGTHASIVQQEGMKDRTVVVNGMSKGYAMTGWRLGYAVAPPEIAEACVKLQGQYTSATCSIAQRAALAALSGTMEPTYRMREAFRQRRDLFYQALQGLYGWECPLPQGAFYLFPRISDWFQLPWRGEPLGHAERVAEFLLEEARVATVAGDAFGCPDCLRLSTASSEDKLLEAARRIRTAIEERLVAHRGG